MQATSGRPTASGLLEASKTRGLISTVQHSDSQDVMAYVCVLSFEVTVFSNCCTSHTICHLHQEDVLMIADPRGLQHIFHKSAYRYTKPADIEHASMKLFGPGVAVVNGDVHQRQRKILNPAFSAAQTKPYAQVFTVAAKSLILKWRGEVEGGAKVLDTVRFLPNMTLDALGESIFEYEFGAMDGKKSSELCDIIRDLFNDSRGGGELKMLRGALYRFAPKSVQRLLDIKKTKEDARFAHWLKTSKGIAQDLVNMKMEDGEAVEKQNDFMSVLSRAMHSTDPEKSMSPEEALSQMATIIFAGHETSASSLNWILYELSKNPKDQEKLFHEIKTLREQTGNEGDFSPKDLEGLTYLNAVIKESLRLHPIVPELVRQAVSDDSIPLDYPIVDTSGSVLREIPVTKGQRITTSIHRYNRQVLSPLSPLSPLKEIWGSDADEWNPERFVNKKTPTTLGVFGNLMTFSGGIRGCIGWRFAVLEIQVVLAALIEAFVFSVPEGIEVEDVRVGLMIPMIKGRWKEGSKMLLEVTLRQA
ncbi:hypothetical protein V5O48_009663 [Marasmius crinis-equi]|uniref:Cytochrome P450 n=1 Tax=Marasmius crinis-equi TaxID=585013 RepID=A0ABR3FAH6_9AGAR